MVMAAVFASSAADATASPKVVVGSAGLIHLE
jgi:hypothetical protein